MIAADPPAPWATARVFRPKAGHKRLYRFKVGESREPADGLLAAQLLQSDYLPAEKYDPSGRAPR